MSPRLQELALRKEILTLKAEAYRLELELDLDSLGKSLRGVSSAWNVASLMRNHPYVVSAAGALISQIGIGRIARMGLIAAGAWFAYQVSRAAHSRGQ
ncbi:MAG TPA: hypothetical protein VLC55_06150 [Burkholderiales bacterium]|nr:hypothetical protein [Burkholderiales bacterium]